MVVNQIWNVVTSSFFALAETWGQQVPIPPIVSVVDSGYNIAMGDIPGVDMLPYDAPIVKKKTKKTIELLCIIGTEEFRMSKETTVENNKSFNVKRIKFEIKQLHEAQLSVTI